MDQPLEPDLDPSLSLPLSQETFSDLWTSVKDVDSNFIVDQPMDFGFQSPPDLSFLDSEGISWPAHPTNGPLPDAPVVPCTEDYVGQHGFELAFDQSGTAKSVTCTYSPILNKLFCQLAKTCAVHIKVSVAPPHGSIIRTVAIYKKSEHVADVVKRCPHHKQSLDFSDGTPADHLIRVEANQWAHYDHYTMTERHFVTVPYEQPQVGTDSSTILYNFLCNSSCIGGMNRRAILTILTLETPQGELLGRRSFEVRVCACPGRDRRTEEENLQKASNPATKPKKAVPQSSSSGIRKQTSAESGNETSTESGPFFLQIDNPKHYKILKLVLDGLKALESKEQGEPEQPGSLASLRQAPRSLPKTRKRSGPKCSSSGYKVSVKDETLDSD